jgi:phosphate transport system substrate-binding protein
VNVGISGTGGGFKRFVVGETDISDASRPIKSSEIEQAQANSIEYVEIRVAQDGLAVTVHPSLTFVSCLTVEELKRIWEPESTVDSWSDVRAEWPDIPLRLYGPGTDSGTFDYFTERVVGKEDASRADYTASEDDNVLVQGIAGDSDALGYFGFAYFAENQGRLRLVAVDDGQGCTLPSDATVKSGDYPLSRPLFIYVNAEALQRPEVRAFVEFYLENALDLAAEVGYTPYEQAIYQEQLTQLRAAR